MIRKESEVKLPQLRDEFKGMMLYGVSPVRTILDIAGKVNKICFCLQFFAVY
jgi:hypothetical protein